MFRKFFSYPVFLVLTLSVICTIFYGALLRSYYLKNDRFITLKNIAVFTAEIPSNIKYMLVNRTIFGDALISLDEEPTDANREFFSKKITTPPRNELILISRHDGDLGRSIVEIRDLNNFEILHTYLPDISEIYENIDFKKEEFKNLISDKGYNSFYMMNPIITDNGELIFQGDSPLVKVDFNSKLMWVNDEYIYHHAQNTDLNGNIYALTHHFEFSKKVSEYVGKEKNSSSMEHFFIDDGISILNQDGEIIFSKSVNDILIENGYVGRIFSQAVYDRDPIHINDIQPVLENTQYFKKGDLFLSLRNLSMIVLYRPSNNKIIKVIEGPFYNQHDIDILDDKRISIYNNNVFLNYKNKRKVKNNEIVTYNFETDSFSKLFENAMIENNINSATDSLIDFLDDGSAIIEDNNNGRILFLRKDGDLIWEFKNINTKNILFNIFWARIIDEEKSEKIKILIKENTK